MSYRCHACEQPTKTSICDRCAVQVVAFRSIYNVAMRNGNGHLESFVHSILATSDEKMDVLIKKYGEKQMRSDINNFSKASVLFWKYRDSDDKKPYFDRMKAEIEKIQSPELKDKLKKMFF